MGPGSSSTSRPTIRSGFKLLQAGVHNARTIDGIVVHDIPQYNEEYKRLLDSNLFANFYDIPYNIERSRK